MEKTSRRDDTEERADRSREREQTKEEERKDRKRGNKWRRQWVRPPRERSLYREEEEDKKTKEEA